METNTVPIYILRGETIMLTEKTNKIIGEVNELKGFVAKQFGSNMFENMDAEELFLMKKLFDLVDAAMELSVTQAEVMDDINAKLDKLLARKEEGSN